MDQAQHPSQRELVYCHQCENEWYRDEHGIVCPECQSDFTEVIEAGQDPREDNAPPPSDHEFYAPDPDEGDIDDFQWHNHGGGEQPGGRFTGIYTRNMHIDLNNPQGGGTGGNGGGLLGMIGPALQGLMGGQRQQGQQVEGFRSPGSPQGQWQQQQGGNGGTFVRHASGPNFSFTITTNSNNNLFPRNANAPQPFQTQPDSMERMMAQMFANIGAMHGQGFGPGGMRAGPGFAGNGGGPPGMLPLSNIFQMFGMPPGGVHGDAVFSQEALDRVISQLMEQHTSGNAPGPASTEAIESLPKRPISQKDLDDTGKADCSICMDTAEVGSMVTELPCGHWFHHDCIKAWLGEHDTCPHCRHGIMPAEEANADRARESSQPPLNNTHSPHYQRPYQTSEYPFPASDNSNTNVSGDAGQQPSSSSGGLFGRMRQAFSPGGSNSNQTGQQ